MMRKHDVLYSFVFSVLGFQSCTSNPAGLLALQRIAFYTTSLSQCGVSWPSSITHTSSSASSWILNSSVGDVSVARLRKMPLRYL